MTDTDTTEMGGPELLEWCGTNALHWAEAFKQHYDKYEFNGENIEDVMVGWFANAMCMQEEAEREKREKESILALGILSGALAVRADAWNGNAPDWFPEPPEWLDLWEKSLAAATADEKCPEYQEIIEAVK